MKKPTTWLFAVIIVVVLCLCTMVGAVMLWRSASSEPSFQGRPLSRWLVDLDEWQPTTTRMVASEAVRRMGTNALPHLVQWLSITDAPVKTMAVEALPTKWRRGLRISSAQRKRLWVVSGFKVLGPAARPAIPQLLNALNDPATSYEVAFALAAIGPEGARALTNGLATSSQVVRQSVMTAWSTCALAGSSSEADGMARVLVPVLVRYLQDEEKDIRILCAQAIGQFAREPEIAIPALTLLLDDKEMLARCAAANALSHFRAAAKSATPALLRRVQDAQRAGERNAMIEALGRIDPSLRVPEWTKRLQLDVTNEPVTNARGNEAPMKRGR